MRPLRMAPTALAAVLAACLAAAAPAVAREVLPPLVEAVKTGDRATALELIARGEGVNAAEADGTTALHWAVRAGDGALVEALLGAGADARAANRYGMTALHLAAVNGDAAVMRELLAAGADVNATLPEGETVLMTAARTGEPEALRVLLEAGADVEARENWYGESALMWAAAEDHAEAVRVLVAHGADVNARSARYEFERRRLGQSILPLGAWTPLMYAARQNALASGRALVEAGADLDATDPDGATALVIAIINAHYEFADMLLEAGADPNVVDESGMGPLYAAVDMHRLAIGHGRPNPVPVGPLDSVDIIRRLLERGADPNAQLKKPIMQRHHTAGDATLGEGATPLLRAAKSGDIEVVRLLLAAGADPHHKMPNGATALMYAAGLGWRNGSPIAPSFDQGSEEEAVETMRLLLELGLDINARDARGDTALHAAVAGRGSETLVRFLIEAGADVTVVNEKGQTPLAVAESRRPEPSQPIVELLRASMPATAAAGG
ncbi:MAG TPA: ankyrin repeat domain-containing protein [Gammaproteobacteria bacterium]